MCRQDEDFRSCKHLKYSSLFQLKSELVTDNFQLAPDVPPQETFVFHWKAITNYFIEATGKESLSVFVYMCIQSRV